MSLRDSLEGVFDHSPLRDTPKQWHVRLLESKIVWFEIVVNRLDPHADLRNAIVDHIREFKQKYDTYSSRRFVYFICTRPRVRFARSRGAKLSFFGNRLRLRLELGAERISRSVSLPRSKVSIIVHGRTLAPVAVSTTPTSITLSYPGGLHLHSSIHDFLVEHGVGLGAASRVEYVGYTKNPHSRPLGAEHRGLTHAVYRAGERGEDIFIYYNTFHVTVLSQNDTYNVNFVLSNAMIGEVDEDTEGQVIESAWIDYFRPEAQVETAERDLSRLRNLRSQLYRDHQITELVLGYEVEPYCDYFSLYSGTRAPAPGHYSSWNCPE